MVKTGDQMRRILFMGMVIFPLFFYIGNSFATDPPHSDAQNVKCSSCHTLHAAPGTSLTLGADNYNLCYSCHKPGDLATNKPIYSTEQATPGTSGRHHRWDRSILAGDLPLNLTVGNAGNIYGLRTYSEVSTTLQLRLAKYGNKIVCSVCHDQHSQELSAWDPNAPAYGGAGTGSGRHFQRMPNDLNQLCEDCHYYRVQTHTTVEGPGDGIKVFSHPVGQALNANAKGYDRAAPLDVNGVAQSGARFAVSGAGDTNDTNNLVVESTTNKVRCLSCHNVHYTDSNGFTLDGPP